VKRAYVLIVTVIQLVAGVCAFTVYVFIYLWGQYKLQNCKCGSRKLYIFVHV